jgi:vacuolar-type H+-ATPase subunit E/Vma4
MRSPEDNIEALSRAISGQAQSEADQLLAEARAKAEDIRRKASQQAAAERAEILDRAKREAERLRSQAVASAQLKARTQQLESREKLLDGAFDGARQSLSSVQRRKDYDEIALRLLKDALAHLAAPAATVLSDEATRKLLTAKVLEAVAKETGVKLELGPALPHGTGVIVQTADGHRQYDNTLETRLRRMQETLRAPVYHLLMGESV